MGDAQLDAIPARKLSIALGLLLATVVAAERYPLALPVLLFCHTGYYQMVKFYSLYQFWGFFPEIHGVNPQHLLCQSDAACIYTASVEYGGCQRIVGGKGSFSCAGTGRFMETYRTPSVGQQCSRGVPPPRREGRMRRACGSEIYVPAG